jgi:hypothetical protein
LKEIVPNIKEIVPNINEIEPNIKEIVPNINEIEPNIKEIEPNIKEIEPNRLFGSTFSKVEDDGCICGACVLKRCEISSKLMRGIVIIEKVKHSDAKQELIHKQEVRIRRVNRIIRQLPPTQVHNKKKDFRGDMNFIVNLPLKRS